MEDWELLYGEDFKVEGQGFKLAGFFMLVVLWVEGMGRPVGGLGFIGVVYSSLKSSFLSAGLLPSLPTKNPLNSLTNAPENPLLCFVRSPLYILLILDSVHCSSTLTSARLIASSSLVVSKSNFT